VSEGVVRAWRLSKARTAGDLTGQGAARDGQQLGLVLPSVVVPQARNLLLNPLHPAMGAGGAGAPGALPAGSTAGLAADLTA
jgi:RES domain-containing protein